MPTARRAGSHPATTPPRSSTSSSGRSSSASASPPPRDGRRAALMARILLISGSLRDGSTNTAALRTAQAAAPEGVETELYAGLATLPHFNPDDDYEPLP